MSNILITSGFVWVLLSYEDALFAFENGSTELFTIHPDGSESLVECDLDLIKVEIGDCKAGIEIGNESELLADWQEATTRNNEKRSFMAWLEDKAENLLS